MPLCAAAYKDRLSLAATQGAIHTGLILGPLKPNLLARFADRQGKTDFEVAPRQCSTDLRRVATELNALPKGRGTAVDRGAVMLRSNNSWMHNYQRLVKGKNNATSLLDCTLMT